MARALITINPAGPTGLAVTVSRTNLQCAPDPVRFQIDLSSVVFQQTAGSNPLIDERFRKLDIHWDFGDSGTWSKPTKLISEHQNKTFALGAWVSHCYQSAGTYNWTATVTERSVLTGWALQFATATGNVTVASQDDTYDLTKTVCVNTVGDSDFADAPTGATQVNANSFTEASTFFTDEFGSERRRFLFKGGSSFDWDVDIDSGSMPPDMCFGSYSTGKATIVPASGGRAMGAGTGYRNTELNDLRIDNLIFAGDWDSSTILLDGVTSGIPNTNFPWTNVGLSMFSPLDLCVSNCEFSGMRGQAMVFSMDQAGNPNTGHWMICDTSVTNCGGQYWIYSDANDQTGASASVIGCSFNPQPGHITGGRPAGDTPFRDEGHQRFHIRSTQIACPDSRNSPAKFMNTPEVENGQIYTVAFNRFEGGGNPFSLVATYNGGGIGRTIAFNWLVESNIFMGDFSTGQTALIRAMGGAFRNNLMLLPGGSALDSATGTTESTGEYAYVGRRFGEFFNPQEVTVGPTIPQNTIDAGVMFYNNTCVNRRTAAENNVDFTTPAMEAVERRFITNLEDANNIFDGELTDANSMGPLTTTLLAAPFVEGFKGAVSQTLDTSYGPDPADMIEAKPDTGSAALSGVTGNLRAYRDITGAVRTYGSEDIGAWQVSNAVTVEQIMDCDFTLINPLNDTSLFPSTGAFWSGVNIAGASSTRGAAGTLGVDQTYEFFVDGADGTIEKASLVDEITAGTTGAVSALVAGDKLDIRMEIKVDGYGFTFFDFEQSVMTTTGGDLNNNGVRVAIDQLGEWEVIYSELSSAYVNADQIPDATPMPLDTWTTIRIFVDLNTDSTGRVRVWNETELVLDHNHPNMFNAADILASDGVTITGTPEIDKLEMGLSALYNSISDSRTMNVRNFTAKVIRV